MAAVEVCAVCDGGQGAHSLGCPEVPEVKRENWTPCAVCHALCEFMFCSKACRDAWEAMRLSNEEALSRKVTPVYSGVLRYFPLAIRAVAQCSYAGNEQHHPGTPLHWDRAKAPDELDALMRHLLDAGKVDTDGIRHSTKVAWRALAALEKELEGLEE